MPAASGGAGPAGLLPPGPAVASAQQQETCRRRLGYKASAEQFAPSKLLAFSVLAEQSGFNSVFVSDHFQPWKHTDGHAPNALVWLGALGASTQRIVMGTSVLTPTFRYDHRWSPRQAAVRCERSEAISIMVRAGLGIASLHTQ